MDPTPNCTNPDGSAAGPSHASTPDDNTTLTEVLDQYERHGFDGMFAVTEFGLVECASCEALNEPEMVSMHSLRRLEGASDPDDSLAVLAITCPQCARQGTLTLMYGPMASTEESDVLSRLQDRRHDDVAPTNSAPGEAGGDPEWRVD